MSQPDEMADSETRGGDAALDPTSAAAALAEAEALSRHAVRRGRTPAWFGIVWSLCMGALYWLNACPEAWLRVGSLVVIVVLLAILVIYRRTAAIQTNGFTQPSTLWLPLVMMVTLIAVRLLIEQVPPSPGVQWQWIAAGVVMTGVGALFWRAYDAVLRRAQMRRR